MTTFRQHQQDAANAKWGKIDKAQRFVIMQKVSKAAVKCRKKRIKAEKA